MNESERYGVWYGKYRVDFVADGSEEDKPDWSEIGRLTAENKRLRELLKEMKGLDNKDSVIHSP